MTLVTQTGSELPRQRDPSQPPSWEVTGNPARPLTLDPARPIAALVGRVRAHLSPTKGFASGGFGVPPLTGDDLDVLEGYNAQVGWEMLPLLQAKQVECSGVRVLIQALKGTVIRLIQSEDNETVTSDMEAMDSSQPQDRSELDPLNLTQGGQNGKKGSGQVTLPLPKPWTRSKSWDMTLICTGVQPATPAWPPDRKLTLNPRIWTLLPNPQRLRVTPVDPWRARMHGTTVTILTPRGAKGRTRRLSVVDCTPRYGPTQFLHHRELITGGTKGRT